MSLTDESIADFFEAQRARLQAGEKDLPDEDTLDNAALREILKQTRP
jgi:hypothetical protein